MSATVWIYYNNDDKKELDFDQHEWKHAVEAALESVKQNDVKQVMIIGGGALILGAFRRGFILEKAINKEMGETDICLASPDPNDKGELDLMWDRIYGEKNIKKRLLKEGRKYLF